MSFADVDTILFDAGGTLVHIDYDTIATLAAAHGVTVTTAQLSVGDAEARLRVDQRLRGPHAAGDTDAARVGGYFADLLRGATSNRQDIDTLVSAVTQAHARQNLWRVPYPDAADSLRTLREAGLATAVISNADGRVRDLLRDAGLLPHLDYVMDSHEEGVEKPDPAIFERALARSATTAAHAVYVGDIYEVDVVGARAAGLTPCLLDPHDRYASADCLRFASMAELTAAVVATR